MKNFTIQSRWLCLRRLFMPDSKDYGADSLKLTCQGVITSKDIWKTNNADKRSREAKVLEAEDVAMIRKYG